MRFAQVHISPEPRRVIEALQDDLRNKVKNALREISRNQEAGTRVAANEALFSQAGSRDNLDGWTLHLYKSGRFRILYHRANGLVWIDALTFNQPVNVSKGTSTSRHSTLGVHERVQNPQIKMSRGTSDVAGASPPARVWRAGSSGMASTSFPRKRESTSLDPRFRGGDREQDGRPTINRGVRK